MAQSKFSLGAMHRASRLLGPGTPDDLAIRQAAWVARCVGRGDAAPLGPADIGALAETLSMTSYPSGALLFRAGVPAEGVWIVQRGRVELSVGSGRRRAVVHLLQPGDVDGDIHHLLQMPPPYTARALDETTALSLTSGDFERLLAERPPIARRWLSSVAQRLAMSHDRVIGLLGRSLTEQVARLLLEEAVDGSVPLPQRTMAAMLGVQRPSLNKILKEFERRGLIDVRYAAVGIRDSKKLLAIVE